MRPSSEGFSISKNAPISFKEAMNQGTETIILAQSTVTILCPYHIHAPHSCTEKQDRAEYCTLSLSVQIIPNDIAYC